MAMMSKSKAGKGPKDLWCYGCPKREKASERAEKTNIAMSLSEILWSLKHWARDQGCLHAKCTIDRSSLNIASPRLKNSREVVVQAQLSQEYL